MSDRPRVSVIHGPNLNLLGEREPSLYGRVRLSDLDRSLQVLGQRLGVDVITAQTNGEGQLIDLLHDAGVNCRGALINPAGYTHTSVAIHDAIRALSIPVVEVHLSNLYAREAFRHRSVTGGACRGVIMGLGMASYEVALRYLSTVFGDADASPPTTTME
ncbi:MAG: type II 3-dehydroquinate dehydratase [Nannocystaceae bacterium]